MKVPAINPIIIAIISFSMFVIFYMKVLKFLESIYHCRIQIQLLQIYFCLEEEDNPTDNLIESYYLIAGFYYILFGFLLLLALLLRIADLEEIQKFDLLN